MILLSKDLGISHLNEKARLRKSLSTQVLVLHMPVRDRASLALSVTKLCHDSDSPFSFSNIDWQTSPRGIQDEHIPIKTNSKGSFGDFFWLSSWARWPLTGLFAPGCIPTNPGSI